MKSIYFIRPRGQDGPIKIGHSTYPASRLKTYMAWSPIPLEIVATLDVAGDDRPRRRHHVLAVELRLHLKHAAARLHHEWFLASPALLADIAAIQASTFDVASLPELPLSPTAAKALARTPRMLCKRAAA